MRMINTVLALLMLATAATAQADQITYNRVELSTTERLVRGVGGAAGAAAGAAAANAGFGLYIYFLATAGGHIALAEAALVGGLAVGGLAIAGYGLYNIYRAIRGARFEQVPATPGANPALRSNTLALPGGPGGGLIPSAPAGVGTRH